jgi:hypothetical protein
MEIFTFCPIKTDDSLIEIFRQELESLSDNYWHYDKFRNCYILPMWNPAAQQSVVDPNLTGPNEFTEAANQCPNIKKYLTPLLYKLNGRLTVLKTLPTQLMNIHIDCHTSEVGTEQYKWRMVVKGNRNSLYFLDENNKKIYPNKNYSTYVMDGGHLHGIDQDQYEEKITICIGSKWRGTPMPDNLIENEKITITRGKIKNEQRI